MRAALLALVGMVTGSLAEPVILREDFNSDPAARGWASHGDTNLFHWDPTNQHLAVTWDSSRTNSYFYRPLGTILAKDDDFTLAFDLRLADIAIGTTPGKPYTFQIAVGLLGFAQATRSNFFRGSGLNATTGPRNVCEFNYFPDSGFGATVSPTIVSSNNQFASGFTFPLELTVGDLFRVTMRYTASNRTLATTMTRNGAPFGPVDPAPLGAAFTDFRLDTLAVMSYSDAGQTPPEFAGSVLAHGIVDNLLVELPPPPVRSQQVSFNSGAAELAFLSRTNWLYTLERSTNLASWSALPAVGPGTGGVVTLLDTNPPSGAAFYRVKAERP
jgi:hypothetical protein